MNNPCETLFLRGIQGWRITPKPSPSPNSSFFCNARGVYGCKPFARNSWKLTQPPISELADALSRIKDRVFDLLPLARANYYHPDMGGSWSIKSVLPTVAPDLDYSNLAVSHGGEAQAAFLEMLKRTEEYEKIRQDLLAYCERDTLAMVRLARFFAGK